MKMLVSVALGLGALMLLPAAGGEDTDRGMPEDMQRYFVGLIYRGDKWTPEVTAETQALQKAHLENIGRLAESGDLVLAGPFGGDGDLRGLFFFNVKTLEDARALADGDPAVKAGRLRVDVLPWWGPKKLATMLKDD